jgi:hypothetical protein
MPHPRQGNTAAGAVAEFCLTRMTAAIARLTDCGCLADQTAVSSGDVRSRPGYRRAWSGQGGSM